MPPESTAAENRIRPAHHFDQGAARAFPVADFQRVGQALAQPGLNDDPIHQNLQRGGKVQVQQRLGVGQLVDASLPVEAVEAMPAQVSQHGLEEFRLPPPGARLRGRTALFQLLMTTIVSKGKQDMETRSRGKGHQPADHLVQHVLPDLGSALPAEGAADSGVEQAQVIIDFGHRSHRGARIAQAVLLLDGDGRRDARHLLHVGFLDTFQELAGVGRERFDIAPLPLGIDGVEGQAGLSRSAHSRNHGQTFMRNLAIDIPEIVYLGASNLKNFPVHGMERSNG